MRELASRLSAFLVRIASFSPDPKRLPHDLRFPPLDWSTMRGSAVGSTLWASDEGRALLELVLADPLVTDATDSDGNTMLRRTVEHDIRGILASAVGEWLGGQLSAAEFAAQVESDLWDCLRTVEVPVVGVTAVPDVYVSRKGFYLGGGRSVEPPNEDLIAWAFPRAWPEYYTHLPSGPFTLFVTQQTVARTILGGMAVQYFGRASAHLVRDAIWLSTGALPQLGSTVAWQHQRFPISDPMHFMPETHSAYGLAEPLELNQHQTALTEMFRRLNVMTAGEPGLELDSRTYITLRNVSDQVDAALHAAGSATALHLAFAAADGSLREPTRGENKSTPVPVRYGMFCGADTAQRRELRRSLEALNPVRDALAHGDVPTLEQVARFVGATAEPSEDGSPTPWLHVDPRSERIARERALDLLRRLYRSWLMATISVSGDQVEAGLRRHEVVDLLRRAQRGDLASLDEVSRLVFPPES